MAIAEDPSEKLEHLVAQYVLGTGNAGVEELQDMAALRLCLSLKRACCSAGSSLHTNYLYATSVRRVSHETSSTAAHW